MSDSREIPEEWVEVSAEAAFNYEAPVPWCEMTEKTKQYWRREQRAAIAAVRPLIEAAQREKDAAVCDAYVAKPLSAAPGWGADEKEWWENGQIDAVMACAKAIRGETNA